MKLLWLTCVVVLLGRISLHLVSQDFNLSSEANGLFGILQLTEGNSLYPPRQASPYYIYLYGPVHGYLSSSLLRLIPTQDLQTQVIAVRTLSTFCLLLLCILGWKFCRKLKIHKATYLLLLPIALSKFADYAGTSRNDMLCITLELLSLYCLLRYASEKKSALLVGFVFVAFAAFMTRFTSGILIATAVLWFVTQKNWRLSLYFFIVGLSFLSSLFVIDVFWDGNFLEHTVLANIRTWRPIDRTLFDLSLKSFLASYLVLPLLAMFGVFWQLTRSNRTPEVLLIAIYGGLSLIYAVSTFLRAGGDVNYFFPVILSALFLGCLGFEQLLGQSQTKSRPYFYAVIGLQFLCISLVYGLKIRSHAPFAFLPFKDAAQHLKANHKAPFFIGGPMAGSMNIYLYKESFHGPDLSNTGLVSQNSHPLFAWLLEDIRKHTADGTIKTSIWIEPDCRKWKRFYANLWLPKSVFKNYKRTESPYSWLCIFPLDESRKEEIRLSRQSSSLYEESPHRHHSLVFQSLVGWQDEPSAGPSFYRDPS